MTFRMVPCAERLTVVVVILGSEAFAALGVVDMDSADTSPVPSQAARLFVQPFRVFPVLFSHQPLSGRSVLMCDTVACLPVASDSPGAPVARRWLEWPLSLGLLQSGNVGRPGGRLACVLWCLGGSSVGLVTTREGAVLIRVSHFRLPFTTVQYFRQYLSPVSSPIWCLISALWNHRM